MITRESEETDDEGVRRKCDTTSGLDCSYFKTVEMDVGYEFLHRVSECETVVSAKQGLICAGQGFRLIMTFGMERGYNTTSRSPVNGGVDAIDDFRALQLQYAHTLASLNTELR